MDSEEVRVKKIQTIRHFGKTSLAESAGILNKFDGDVVKSVLYAQRLPDIQNKERFSDEDLKNMMTKLKPFVNKIKELYTEEEIITMHQELKERNDVASQKFIERLVYGYMGKLK